MGTNHLNDKFDFDREINREATASLKYEARQEVFRADVTPLWVADMDFAAPPAVSHALAERAAHLFNHDCRQPL